MIPDKCDIPKGYSAVNMFVIVKENASDFIKFVEDVFEGKERTYVRTPDKDGKLIHAEIQIGDSSILVADSKDDWPFTPAFIQIYVKDAQVILDRATKNGARVITERSDFYNGVKLARIQDAWGNIWWLYEPEKKKDEVKPVADVSWHDKKPSAIYTSLMDAMRKLNAGKPGHR
jgi:PhnB protein